ncbi:MAG: DoxX family protein [Acidimicrobiia bacterium]|jgi:thiosulfate dehydrogenase [quinone] large subunit
MAETVTFEEPPIAKTVFASSKVAWIWLIVRLWVGWEWFSAGWEKVFGGAITWKVWDWGNAAYSLTGTGNIGWVRSGTVVAADGTETVRGVGDAVAGFAAGAVNNSQGAHPSVAFSWYVEFLKWVQHTAYPVIGPVVAIAEVVIGVALIAGAFVGIAAFFGATLNFSYLLAGSAGVNPAMIVLEILLVLAWRNSGWLGADRWLLPRLGVPWQRDRAMTAPTPDVSPPPAM